MNLRVVALAVVVLSGTATGASPDAGHRRPSVQVFRSAVPIKVDGILDDPAWVAKALPTVTLVSNSDGSPSPLKSEARLVYDDRFLYFAFRFEDPNIWATMKRRDEHLWTEEVFEVFVQADPAQTSYLELELNPLGTLIDIFLVSFRKALHFESWNSEKIAWAVQVEGTVDGRPGDKGWTSEIALPLEDVVPAPNIPPKPGDRWRLNFYRVEKLPESAYLSWSPTGKDFHKTALFGEIVFSERCVP